MKKPWPILIGGFVLLVIGVVWCLQGSGVMGQSGGMNGKSQWLVVGLVVAAVGLALLVVGALGLRRGARK